MVVDRLCRNYIVDTVTALLLLQQQEWHHQQSLHLGQDGGSAIKPQQHRPLTQLELYL